MTDNTVYAIWLSRALGPASRSAMKLAMYRGDDPLGIYKCDDFEGLGLHRTVIDRLLDKDLSESIEIYGRCERSGISVVRAGDKLYPKLLAAIPDRPYLLYVKGDLRPLDEELCVAMVGTRNASDEGKHITRALSAEMTKCGAVIVSGLAYGIDSQAHLACLENGGFTVAVLGCGHERARRWDNARLLEDISKRGMVVSEYPPSAPASRITFPQRNRIISGLSRAVVITEAPNTSGALITADYARKQGRLLFASPGNPALSGFAGTMELLRNGAKLATCAEDVLKNFDSGTFGLKNPDMERIIERHTVAEKPAPAKETAVPPETDDTEKRVLEEIKKHDALTADEILCSLGLPVDKINEALTMLEIEGAIKPLPGQRFKAT